MLTHTCIYIYIKVYIYTHICMFCYDIFTYAVDQSQYGEAQVLIILQVLN